MKSHCSMVLVATGLALASMTAHAAEKAPEKKEGMIPRVKEITEDSTITGRVKTEFARDKAVSALGINVDTNKGVVTLSGNAKSREEADKAVAIAKSTPGVSSVKNEIRVSGPAKK